MKKLNLNDHIKVKLTDYGKQVYYEFHKQYEQYGIQAPELKPDENGYVEFQLWHFMQMFGCKMYNGGPCVAESVSIYIDDDVLEDCK